jgi:hypothetical protein
MGPMEHKMTGEDHRRPFERHREKDMTWVQISSMAHSFTTTSTGLT